MGNKLFHSVGLPAPNAKKLGQLTNFLTSHILIYLRKQICGSRELDGGHFALLILSPSLAARNLLPAYKTARRETMPAECGQLCPGRKDLRLSKFEESDKLAAV